MKKLLSVLLTLVLVVSALAVIPVSAEDVKPFTVGEEAFATLAEAYDALPEEGGVITLTADYTTETDVGLAFEKPVTIKAAEGTDYTITVNAAESPYARWITVTAAKLVIENIDLNLTRGFKLENGAELNVVNSTVTMELAYTTKPTEGIGGAFAFTDIASSKAVLDHTTVNYCMDTQNKNVTVYAQPTRLYGTNAELTLINASSITSTSDTDNGTTTNYICLIDYADNGSTSTEGTTATINVGKNCSLVNKMYQTGDQGKRNRGIIFSRGSSTPHQITVNLDEGSTLEIDSSILTYSTSVPGWIVGNGTYTDKYTVNDNGCTYIVRSEKKHSASGSIKDGCLMYFPKVVTDNTEATFYDVNDSSITVENGGSYTIAKQVRYEFKFGTPPAPLAPLLTNIAGASIRTDAPYGIRFGATVNADTYAALVAEGATIKFGMALVPYEVAFSGKFFEDYDLLIEDGTVVLMDEITVDALADDGSYSLALYITDDETLEASGKDVLTATIYACAYYTVTYADGTSETVFADNANARSIYDVASAYKTKADAGEAGFPQIDFVDRIVATCA